MTRKRIVLSLLTLLVAFGVYLFTWPVPIDPAPWNPPEAPGYTGDYAPNSFLEGVQRIDAGGVGPEDVAIAGNGKLYFGLEDGRIMRTDYQGAGLEEWINTGGRPLGLAFGKFGALIIADADKGLLSVTPDRKITVLATEAGGVPFRFTDDLDVGPNGTIFFTDASSKFSVRDYRLDLLEHRPNGRLLAYVPKDKKVHVMAEGLYFANGVAVSHNTDFVLVVETARYRVKRFWISGPKKGKFDVLIDNLPGFPDGISRGDFGVFWIAIASPRNGLLDMAMSRPWLRKVIARLPTFMQPSPDRYGMVLGVDVDGVVLHNLQDPTGGSFSPITSVEEHGNHLFLGSLTQRHIGKIKKPARKM